MQDHDLVSVVLPVHNGAATIDETLRSVRSQTFGNLEIIIVDDGSDDETLDIVSLHAAADWRVRLHRQPQGGVAAARNAGIAQARGKVLAFIDADDLWAPEKIAKQIAALRAAGPQYAVVYTWYALIDKDSRIIDRSYRPSDSGDVLARLCYGNLVGNGSSAIITKAALLEAGGFDASLRARSAQGCEDLQLYFHIAERHRFALVPEYLTGYRRTPTNMSSDLLQMYRSWMLVTGDVKRRQPMLATAIEKGRNLFIGGLLERAIAFRQPAPALFLASQLLCRDPMILAEIVSSRVRGVISRSCPHSAGSQVPPPERFVIGDSALPSRDTGEEKNSAGLGEGLSRSCGEAAGSPSSRPSAGRGNHGPA
jgi:glycosyltransferase involved in cell wall biosynthesis